MADCLVTQLLAEVNNSSLRKLGEARIDVTQVANPDYGTSGTQRLVITSSTNQTLKCLNGGAFVNGSGEDTSTETGLAAGTQKTLILKNANFQLSIPDKYSLTYMKMFSSLSINVTDLSESVNLMYLSCKNLKGNIEALKNIPFSTLFEISGSTGLYGDIKNLNSGVTECYMGGCGLYGNVKDLGHCVNMTRIIANDDDLTGRIEDMAAAQVAKGRVSGSIICNFIRTGVTYGDTVINRQLTITFSSSGYSIA